MPVFSICIPTKNRASSHLKDLINSIEYQILPAQWVIEVIICDDGSTEEERNALLNIVNKCSLDIKLIHHDISMGVSEARNSAVLNSSGALISDIDDDDILPRYSLKNRIDFHNATNCSWSYGSALVVDKNLRYKINKDLIPTWDTDLDDVKSVVQKLLNGEIFYYPSTRTYTRDALILNDNFIRWDEELPVAEDLDHWIRLVIEKGVPKFNNYPLALWREKRHSLGISSRRSGLMHDMQKQIRIKYSEYLR